MKNQYTDQTYFVLNFLMFCYNYDRDVLRNAFREVEKAQGSTPEDYFWDYFLDKTKEMRSQFAVIETFLKIGSFEGRNAFVKYIMDNYKGV